MSTTSNYPRCVQIQVHLDAIAHNYQLLRQRTGSKAFAVVKADAYGHGAEAVASYLSDVADGFAVVTVGEAIAIRDAGVTQPILVMQGPHDSHDMDAVFEHALWPALHDEAQIRMVLTHRNALDVEPWLKVDTGMGRLGVSVESAEQHLKSNQLRWRGVMSHLASADELDSAQTDTQTKRFLQLMANHDLESSLANSAGTLAWPSAASDWARVGIGMYGYNPIESQQNNACELRIGMTVQAPVLSVKRLPAGHSVGYAQTYVCAEALWAAYAAIGYGDGLPRVLDSLAEVQMRGINCPIIGRVSMDSICIDCGPLLASELDARPELGEMITVWGQGLSVERLARSAGTISYELLTSINGRRLYTD